MAMWDNMMNQYQMKYDPYVSGPGSPVQWAPKPGMGGPVPGTNFNDAAMNAMSPMTDAIENFYGYATGGLYPLAKQAPGAIAGALGNIGPQPVPQPMPGPAPGFSPAGVEPSMDVGQAPPPPVPPNAPLTPQDEAMWAQAEAGAPPRPWDMYPSPLRDPLAPMNPPVDPARADALTNQGPDPFQDWMDEYDSDTEMMIQAAKRSNKSMMYANMAKAFAAGTAGNWGATLGGVADAAGQYAEGKAGVAGMGPARKSGQMDELVKYGQFQKYMRPEKDSTSWAEKRTMYQLEMVQAKLEQGVITPEMADMQVEQILGDNYVSGKVGDRSVLFDRNGFMIVDGQRLSPSESSDFIMRNKAIEAVIPGAEKSAMARADFEARVAHAMSKGKDIETAQFIAGNDQFFSFLYPEYAGIGTAEQLDRVHKVHQDADAWFEGEFRSAVEKAEWESLTPAQKRQVMEEQEGQ